MSSLYLVFEPQGGYEVSPLKFVFHTREAVDTFMRAQTWYMYARSGQVYKEHPYEAHEVLVGENGAITSDEVLDYSAFAPEYVEKAKPTSRWG